MSDKLTDDEQRKIDEIMESSLGAVTTRDLGDMPDRGATAWELDKRSPERSVYAPAADSVYNPNPAPTSPLADLDLLPWEQEQIADEQHSRAIAAQVLTKLFTNTFRQERGERALPIRALRRKKRGWWASLLGALRLSR